MNDLLVTALTAVVSKLLVIAPNCGITKPSSGVSQGEKPRQLSSSAKMAVGKCCAFAAPAIWVLINNSHPVAKTAFTSATFVQSGAERIHSLRTGIFDLSIGGELRYIKCNDLF